LKLLFRKSLHLFSFISAGLLLLSYLSVHISPEKISVLALFGLAFPFLLFLNFGLFVYLLIKKKKLFLVSALAIALGFSHIDDLFSFNIFKTDSKSQVKLLSYNVRMFDLYKWSKNKNIRQEIYKILKTENADILCFQEFYSCRADKFSTYDSITKILGANNYNISHINRKKKTKVYGTAIFSKYPIVKSGKIELGKRNKKCIYSDILIDTDTLRIYNIHLASIHLGYDDYKFMDNINTNENSENIKNATGIIMKLTRAYSRRATEADAISAHIKSSPYPVILCGDFNDVPVSYTYRKIRHRLTDAFNNAGYGLGSTYSGRGQVYLHPYIPMSVMTF